MEIIDLLLYALQQVLGQAYIMIGLVTLFGMLLLRKPISEVFTSTLKAMFGMVILFLGVGGMIGPIITMSSVLNTLFGVTGLIPGGQPFLFGITDPVDFAMVSSITLVLAFFIQLLIARFTRWKYVYIVGNMMWVWAMGVPSVLCIAITDPVQLILISSVLTALYWTIGPAVVHQWDKEWIPGAAYTLGHAQYIGEILGGYIGPYIGDPEKESAEKLKFPGWLAVFQDNTILNTAVLLVMWIVVTVVAGPAILLPYTGGLWLPIWILSQALNFTCGLTVILFGVRIMIGQLTVAFEGFKEKLVPGAVPAYDCPTVYPYGPQAMTLGFITYLIGQAAGTLSMALMHFPYITLPGTFLFFDGSTIGIYCDKRGGWKTVVLVCLLTGFLCVWGVSLQWPLYPASIKIYPGTFSGNLDQSLLWVPLIWLANLFRKVP